MNGDQLQSLHYMQLYEAGHFILVLLLGLLLGRLLYTYVYHKEIPTKRRYLHFGLAALFAILAVVFMFTGSSILPFWVSRYLIFFTGYYLGMGRIKGK